MTLAYTMSLVHKIPPLVSALAFGYGVGMAAPDSTISSVKAAVSVVHQDPAGLPAVTARAPEKAPPASRPSSVGAADESRELARLRDATQKDQKRGEACDLDRPSFSRSPRYESKVDREVEDVDDLDPAGADALSRLQLPDIKIPVTRRTLKYVKFFARTERGRGMFEAWLKRSGRYQEMIEAELRGRRLPEDLIWVAMIESGFDPRIKSPAGAVGLWQFMPATGAVYGLLQNRAIDQRRNPKLATMAAAHHLRDLYMRFGAWDLALAAYNMGYEQLLDAIDRYGTADFNELARQEAIPSETSAYVPKIMAAAIVANNLEHFGFDRVELSRPIDEAEIAAPPGTPLKLLAKASGVATSVIRGLNPDILGDRVPPGRGDYLVMIPADTVSRARAALPAMLENEPIVVDDAAALSPVDMLTGRTLTKRRLQHDDDSLLSLLPPPKHRGTLRDPSPDLFDDRGDDASARDDDPGSDGPTLSLSRDRLLDRDRDDDAPRRSLIRRARRGRETLMYRVAPGDTVLGIARQFAVDVDDVTRQNRLDEGDKLKVGSLLRLRVRRDLLGDQAAAGPKDDDKDAKDKAAPSSRTPLTGSASPRLAPRREAHHRPRRDPG